MQLPPLAQQVTAMKRTSTGHLKRMYKSPQPIFELPFLKESMY
jgi:hypothetical protein